MKRAAFVLIFFIALTFAPKLSHAALQMSVDGHFIEFGLVDLGEFKELKDRGDYQNAVTCSDDSGQTWYLKIHLATPLRWGMNEMPPENFKWKVVDVINGQGYPTNRNEFNDFSDIPMVTYISSPEDNSGNEVTIRFSYGLRVPSSQLTGNYQATIRYTLTETL